MMIDHRNYALKAALKSISEKIQIPGLKKSAVCVLPHCHDMHPAVSV